jgi:bacterial/archaeal transporter family protein
MGALGLSKGMRIGNASIISPITSVYPVITIFLSLIFLKEPITAFQSFCIVLIIIGTVLISLNLKNILKSDARKTHLGIEFALISLVGWGLFFFFISILTTQVGWFESMLLATIPQLAFFLLYGYITKDKFRISTNSLPKLSFMGFLAFLGFIGYNLGVTYTYTSIVTPISAASIVIVVILAVLLLKEKLELYQILGILMVILGVVLISV